MFGIRELNVAIEVWGTVFCLVGIVCVIFLTAGNTRYRALLLTMFITNMLYMSCNAVADVYGGMAGIPAWFATHAGQTLSYLMGYLFMGSISFYLYAKLSKCTGADFWKTRIVVAIICDVWCLMSVCGVFYYIDSNNMYQRTEWYWLCLLPIMVINLIGTLQVVRHRHELGRTEFAFLLLYNLLPLPASLVQTFVYGLNYTVIISSIVIIIVLLDTMVQSAKLLANRTQQLEISREQLAESRIAVMVSQIQPHFLFNTLDSIYYLCVTDSDRAADAVDKFSTYLRANLDSLNRTSSVPFATELAHVRTYLELEKISKAELLEFEIDVQAKDFFVPALSVQTIVENAVRHGVSKRPEGGTVTIHTYERDDAYCIVVHDDGVGFDVDAITSTNGHVGIQNTKIRLAAMCGGTLSIRSVLDEGTTATICIPKKVMA